MLDSSYCSCLRAWLFGGLMMLVLPFAHAASLVVEHAQGTTALPVAPQRVAVFDLATLDTLQALEVEVVGVPQASWPKHLHVYAGGDYTRIGTLFEPDYEVLSDLEPDLIIVAGRSRSSYEQLTAIAPTIDLSIDANSFITDVRRNLELLGRIFEKRVLAQELDDELASALAALQAAGAQAGSALTLFTVNGNVMIHAPGERFGMIHELTGMKSVAPPAEPQARGERPKAGTPEAEVLAESRRARLAQATDQEPDWLFVLDRGAATGGEPIAAATFAEDEHIASSMAWRNKQVYYLDPPTWYIATGGYQGLLQTIEAMQEVLAPSAR